MYICSDSSHFQGDNQYDLDNYQYVSKIRYKHKRQGLVVTGISQ